MTKHAEMVSCDRIQTLSMASYVKGILPVEESRAIQEHISKCSDCADDYKVVKQLTLEVEGVDFTLERLLSGESRERSLDALLASEVLNEGVGDFSVIEPVGRKASQTRIESGLFGFSWRQVPSLFKGVVVAQALALSICFALLFGLNDTGLTDDLSADSVPSYTTLTAPPTPDKTSEYAPGVHVFRVMFHPKATERDIRDLIASVRGQITNGPSLSGVYSIAVHGDLEREAVLLKLRSSPWMEFVEPVLHLGSPQQ